MGFTPFFEKTKWQKWSKVVHFSRHGVNHLQAHGEPAMNQLATFEKERHQEMDNLKRKCCLQDKSGG